MEWKDKKKEKYRMNNDNNNNLQQRHVKIQKVWGGTSKQRHDSGSLNWTVVINTCLSLNQDPPEEKSQTAEGLRALLPILLLETQRRNFKSEILWMKTMELEYFEEIMDPGHSEVYVFREKRSTLMIHLLMQDSLTQSCVITSWIFTSKQHSAFPLSSIFPLFEYLIYLLNKCFFSLIYCIHWIFQF